MGRPKKYQKYNEQEEHEFKQQWLDKLKPYFTIKEEVSGTHLSGQKLRIDAVIIPKDLSDWKNKEIAFGIEFKSPTKIDRLGNQLNFMKQCVDYSYTKFDSLGFIPILSCPQFEIDEVYSNDKSLTTLRHFLNRFQVGELYETHRGLSIIYAEHHFIWFDGKVHEGKRWMLNKEFGNKK